MRKIIVSEFVSLDGVMQAPGGAEEDTDGGFAHGGWTGPYWHDDIGANLLQEINQSDTLLLGRRTWQGHAEAFENAPADDPFAGLLNNLRKYVVSTTLKSADAWRNSTRTARQRYLCGWKQCAGPYAGASRSGR
jgi:dihydrofolate reductase